MQARITKSALPPQVQRKCGCATGGDCGCGGKKKVQRKGYVPEAGDFFEEEADRVAEQVPPGGAQPLPYYERTLGHDFSRVRIHDDAHAHARADAQNARAFTYGSDVYFARGELARPDASRLIAHELAHTVQQGAATTVRRKATESCSPEERIRLDMAQVRGASWIDHAIKGLDAYAAAPGPPKSDPVAAALEAYFSTSAEYVQLLRDRLDAMRIGIRGSAGPDGVGCVPNTDSGCDGAPAFVRGQDMFFCRFALAPSVGTDDVTTYLVHEAAHKFAANLGEAGHATDRAYMAERLMAILTVPERFDNADSYAMFVLTLSGQMGATHFRPPKGDDIEGCPEADRPKLRAAIARAERWNNDVQEELGRLNQAGFASAYGALFAPAKPAVTDVRNVFRQVKSILREQLHITCVDKGDSHCPGNIAYFWPPGGPSRRLHICPAYLTVPEEQQVHDMYRMLFQYTRTMTGAQAEPYVQLVKMVGQGRGAPMIRIKDPTPRLLPQDTFRYIDLYALVRRASEALLPADDAAVRTLVTELRANLDGPSMILRFNGAAGELPRYSSLTNVLQLPVSGVSDAEMLLSLFRETKRMRSAVQNAEEPEVVTSQTARAAELEMAGLRPALVELLVRAGIAANTAAGTEAYRKGSKREVAEIAAVEQTTIFPIHVSDGGSANLAMGTSNISLGVIPHTTHDRAGVEAWLRHEVLQRAQPQIQAAVTAGSKVLRFRIYQYDSKVGEFEVRP